MAQRQTIKRDNRKKYNCPQNTTYYIIDATASLWTFNFVFKNNIHDIKEKHAFALFAQFIKVSSVL